MIWPRKKRSIAKKHQNRNMWMTRQMKKLTKRTNIVTCTNCKSAKLSHRVCKTCGYYGDKQVLTIKTKSSEQIVDA